MDNGIKRYKIMYLKRNTGRKHYNLLAVTLCFGWKDGWIPPTIVPNFPKMYYELQPDGCPSKVACIPANVLISKME